MENVQMIIIKIKNIEKCLQEQNKHSQYYKPLGIRTNNRKLNKIAIICSVLQ